MRRMAMIIAAAVVMFPVAAFAQVTAENCQNDIFRIQFWNECMMLGITGGSPPPPVERQDFGSDSYQRPNGTYVPFEEPCVGPREYCGTDVPPAVPPEYTGPDDQPLVPPDDYQIAELQGARAEVYDYIIELQNEVPYTYEEQQWLRAELEWAWWQLNDIDRQLDALYYGR